jgi:hypothetical protein
MEPVNAPADDPDSWAWSDAWVLLAITLRDGGGGCSLTEVIAAADAINHAIPLDSELEQAARRLLGAGLVQVRDRRLFVTEAGRNLEAVRTDQARARGVLPGQVGRLLDDLQGLPVTEHDWALEPGELSQAVGAWHGRAERLIAGRGHPPKARPAP